MIAIAALLHPHHGTFTSGRRLSILFSPASPPLPGSALGSVPGCVKGTQRQGRMRVCTTGRSQYAATAPS